MSKAFIGILLPHHIGDSIIKLSLASLVLENEFAHLVVFVGRNGIEGMVFNTIQKHRAFSPEEIIAANILKMGAERLQNYRGHDTRLRGPQSLQSTLGYLGKN